MVEGTERDTTLIFRTLNNTARVFKNEVAKQVLDIEGRDGDTNFADIQPLVAGARGRERVIEQGETDDGVMWAGMVVGLIDDIPSCAELIERMVTEARESAQQSLAALS